MSSPSPNPGGNVYNRNSPEDVHRAWNAVIRKVNEERGDPPEGTNCEALDPIEEVEEDHIWTKQNVEDLRSAIDEMCEFAWVEDLEFWHDEILVEIDDALDREYGGWGDEDECCEDDCLADCDNATDEPVETYFGSYSLTACLPNPDPACTIEQREAAHEAGSRCDMAIIDWIGFWREYCALVDEVGDLERELEVLQTQLDALIEAKNEECAKPTPNRCAQRQQEVDDKQQEVDDKQEELDEKIDERDAKLTEAADASDTADTEAASSMALADVAAPHGCQFLYTSCPGNEPWTNWLCEELGPECLGREPARCRVWWRVQRLSHQYFCWGGEYHGDWGWEMVGGYTITGQPYVTRIRACSGISGYACSSSGPNPCAGGQCGTGCISYYEQEVRMIQDFPSTTEDGEECCDD